MSRDVKELQPAMQLAVGVMFQLASEAGLELLVTCTRRTAEEQAALYAIGRTTPGKIVTRALPGRSAHQYGLAIDCVPMVAGKPMWDAEHPSWQKYGECVAGAGLDWAGLWVDFKEYPHAQIRGFNWRKESGLA